MTRVITPATRRVPILRAVLAAALVAGALAGCGVDYTVTEMPEEQDLTTAEIRSKLKSGSFREKLEARKQIGKLEREPRLQVLRALAADEDRPTRTIAIQELGVMLPDPGAQETLEQVAREDADPDLRALAQEKLAPAPDTAPAPPPEPAPAPEP